MLCFVFFCFLTPRLGIKACVVIIPQLGVTWLFGLFSPKHKAFATQRYSGQCSIVTLKNHSISIIYFVF